MLAEIRIQHAGKGALLEDTIARIDEMMKTFTKVSTAEEAKGNMLHVYYDLHDRRMGMRLDNLYNALLPLNMPGKIIVECLLIADESRLTL
jgi:hypothetical protein